MKFFIFMIFIISLLFFFVYFKYTYNNKYEDFKNKIKVCCNHKEDPENKGLIDMFEKYRPKNKKILIAGSFIDSEEKVEKILLFKGLKILFVSEPIEFFFKDAYELYKKGVFDIVIGCVSNGTFLNSNKIIKHIKYPIYLFSEYIRDKTIFKEINRMVKENNSDIILQKKFCSLINTHDRGNTRTNIYKKLLKLGKEIECPSTLFNNTSNEELNRIGKKEYGKKFLFTICPENFRVNLKGYITEKLLEACLSGCIPIYFGSMDSLDFRIFNKNRILFYDPFENDSIQKVYEKIKFLMDNPYELLNFYTQDVFQNTAEETVEYIQNNLTYQLQLLG